MYITKIYKSEEHKKRFEEKIEEFQRLGKALDVYRIPVIYLYTMTDKYYENFDLLYNIEKEYPISLNESKMDKTSSDVLTMELALNLYNSDRNNANVEKIFHNSEDFEYYIEAIKMHYSWSEWTFAPEKNKDMEEIEWMLEQTLHHGLQKAIERGEIDAF